MQEYLQNLLIADEAVKPQQSQHFYDWLYDALPSRNLGGATTAVAVDSVLAFYNLGRYVNTDIFPELKPEEALSYIADLGYNDPLTYYNQHPLATSMLGLVAGGWKVTAVGGKVLMDALFRGSVSLVDGTKVISAAANAEKQAAELSKLSHVASAEFATATRKVKLFRGLDQAGEFAMGSLVGDLLMSQHELMREVDTPDMAAFAAVSGVIGFAASGLPSAYQVIKGITSPVAQEEGKLVQEYLVKAPTILQDTSSEVAWYSRKAEEVNTFLEQQRDQLPLSTSRTLDSIWREHEAKAKLSMNKILPDSLKLPTDGSKVDEYSYTTVDTLRRKIHELGGGELAGINKILESTPRDSNEWAKPKVLLHLSWNAREKREITILPAEDAKTHANSAAIRTRSFKLQPAKDPLQREFNVTYIGNMTWQAAGRFLKTNKIKEFPEGTIEHAVATIRAIDGAPPAVQKAWANKGLDMATPLNNAYGVIHNHMNHMLDEGKTAHQVSMETGLPVPAISDYIMSGRENFPLFTHNWEYWKYRKRSNILTAFTEEHVEPYAKYASKLDAAQVRETNALHAQTLASTSDSPLVEKLVAMSRSGIVDAIRSGLTDINAALFGSRVLGSTDHALRHQKVAKAALYYGDQLTQETRAHYRERTKEFNALLQGISQDTASRVEMNVLINAIRSEQHRGTEVTLVQDNKIGVFDIEVDNAGKASYKFVRTLKDNKGRDIDGIKSPQVAQALAIYQDKVNKDIFELRTVHRYLMGGELPVYHGLKMPAAPLHKQFTAFVVEGSVNGRTVMLNATSQEALDGLIRGYSTNKFRKHIITSKTDAELHNKLFNHAQLQEMGVADAYMSKTSVVYDNVPMDTSLIAELQDSIQRTYFVLAGKLSQALTDDIHLTLERMGELHGASKDNVWHTIQNTLQGVSELNTAHPKWNGFNQGVTAGVGRALDIINTAAHAVRHPTEASLHKQAEHVLDELQQAGLASPWTNAAAAVLRTKAYQQDKRLAQTAFVHLQYGVTLLALRFLEIAHPLVTMLSIPITTIPEVAQALQHEGAQAGGAMKLMMEGVYRAFHPGFRDAVKLWEDKGISSSQVSEVTELLRESVVTPSLIQKLEGSPIIRMATFPSNFAEQLARRVAAATGSVVYDLKHGKGAYLTEDGLAFTDLFTKRAMGNYRSTQRPIMFQGNIGNALGLFQTYVWTMGQNVFRYLEQGNTESVASLLALQGSIYGLASLPGYDLLNHYIGEHYGNPEHRDITSTVYSHFNQPINRVDGSHSSEAEAVLYGLPSALLNASVYTRGTIEPRFPVSANVGTGTIDAQLAALAPFVEAWRMSNAAYDRISHGGNIAQAVLTGLQMQHLSRPIARSVDLALGYSVDMTGTVIDPATRDKWDLSILARIASMRPLEEQLHRNVMYQNKFYDMRAEGVRRQVIRTLRQGIANDSLDSEELGNLMRDYLNEGGSPHGWRAAVNEAYLTTTLGKPLEDTYLTRALEAVQ